MSADLEASAKHADDGNQPNISMESDVDLAAVFRKKGRTETQELEMISNGGKSYGSAALLLTVLKSERGHEDADEDSLDYNLSRSGLRRQMFMDRVSLEVKMSTMLPRVFLFMICFILFIVMQQVERAPQTFADINLRLRGHLEIDESLYPVTQMPQMLNYLGFFVERISELAPLDIYHWCSKNDTQELPLNRIRCKRDTGKKAGVQFTDHYNQYDQKALHQNVREIIDKVNQLDGNSPAPAPSCGAGGRRMRAYVDAKGRTESGTKGVNQASPRRTAVDRRSPRVRDLVLALPMPSEAARVAAEASRAATKQQEGPHLPSSTGGVVGVAVNGVLLVGQHFTARGRAAATSWHFDNCGGHGDENGWYHYHFPSLCLLETLRLARPSLHDWWAREEPLAYWPPLAEAFPVLAYALDGVPILGPYGLDGRLMQASELDRCNGKVVRLSDGREEYRYFWTAMSPFLPPCFWGQPVALNLSSVPGGSEACDREGSSPGSTKLAAPEVGVESNSTQVWVLRSTGCPDHRFFYGDVKASSVARSLSNANDIPSASNCSASNFSGHAKNCSGTSSCGGGSGGCKGTCAASCSTASCCASSCHGNGAGCAANAFGGCKGTCAASCSTASCCASSCYGKGAGCAADSSVGCKGTCAGAACTASSCASSCDGKGAGCAADSSGGCKGTCAAGCAAGSSVECKGTSAGACSTASCCGSSCKGNGTGCARTAGPSDSLQDVLLTVLVDCSNCFQFSSNSVVRTILRTAYVTAVGPYGEKVDVSVYCPGDQAVTQAVLSTGCDAKAPGCSATGCNAAASGRKATGCKATASGNCSATGCSAGRRVQSSASITFRVGGLTGSEAGLLSAAIQKDFKTPAQVSGGITAASLQLLQNQSGSSVAAAQALLAGLSVRTTSVVALPSNGQCSASCGGAESDSIVDIFNPCAGAFASDVQAPPEYYNRYKPFSMITAVMGQPLICQVRRKPMQCKSKFVDDYNHQPINVKYQPPWNAPRNSSILRCKSSEYDTSAHLGYMPTIKNGVPQYCVFLSEQTLLPMMDFEWMDDMTEKVTVSALIFTPDVDTLTLAELFFDFSLTGRIRSQYAAKTQLALQDSERFELWRGVSVAFVLMVTVRLLILLRHLRRPNDFMEDPEYPKGSRVLKFDIAMSFTWIAFGVYSIVRKAFDESLLSFIMPLLTQFLGVQDTTDTNSVQQTINSYFDAMNAMLTQIEIESTVMAVAYTLIMLALARLILYMSVHPRIDVISRTLMNAADDIFHFLVVFSFVFFVFAWLAHWSFGPDKEAWSTYQILINTCFQMLVGQFPFGDEWTEDVLQKVWYYTFTFLIYFVSVNILLAIIVEAFLRVKAVNELNTSEINAAADLVALLTRHVLGAIRGWPSNRDLLRHLRLHAMSASDVTPLELKCSRITCDFPSQFSADQLIDFYYNLMGPDILGSAGTLIREKQMMRLRDVRFVMSLFGVRASRVPAILACITKLQATCRMMMARKLVAKKLQYRRKVEGNRQGSKNAMLGNGWFSEETQPGRFPFSNPCSPFDSWRHADQIQGAAPPSAVHSWSKSQVRDWLVDAQGMSKTLAEKFYDEEVDGSVLVTLIEEDLHTTFGLTSFGSRRKLFKEIQQLLTRPTQQQWDGDASVAPSIEEYERWNALTTYESSL